MAYFAVSKLHRIKTFAAKATMVARRVRSHFSTPDAVEQQMAKLPLIQSAEELAGKCVLITGASQGVGLVLARAFADKGARVALIGRRLQPLEEAAKTITAAQAFAGDVSRLGTADRLVADVTAAFGPVDILINNAGVGGPWGKPFWQVDEGAFAETVEINLNGAFQMGRAVAAAAVAASRPCRIINVTSVATEMSFPGIAAYSGSKAGLEDLTRAMASDAAGGGVVAVTVSLHSVQTERKAEHDWASNALLPPTEVVVPAFLHAATAPAAQVQGRAIAAWRFADDAVAEARLAGPNAAIQPIAYPPFMHRGAVVARDPLRFSINDRAENPYGPSDLVAAAVQSALTTAPLSHYPEEQHETLTAALAAHHGLGDDSFAIGNGSWEVLARIVPLFAKPGEEVLSHSPGWFGFNMVCARAGVAQVTSPFTLTGPDGPSHNLPAMLERITPRTRLVYLIHPSNPEGVPLKQAEMEDFLRLIPDHLPVIVDEAYIDYATGEGLFDTVAALRNTGKSIIGLRTFSKFHALAGARVGYAYAAPELAGLIRRAEHIFAVSSLSEAAAVAALKDTARNLRMRELFSHERARVFDGLAARGLDPLPSQAPYVLAKRPKGIDAAMDALEDQGIYIARYAFHNDEYMMFPVGLPTTTDAVFKALDRDGCHVAA